jgi:uncharacterized protein (TIGR03437 family)
MKKYGVIRKAILALLVTGAWSAHAQSGLSATPGTLSFSYQVNSSTYPAALKVAITGPSTLTLKISTTQDWLSITPDTGHTPLQLSVTVNPTGIPPGSYGASITIDTVTAPHNPIAVAVTLSISNPPSKINVTPATSTTNYSAPPPGSSSPSLLFSYTTGTGATTPASSELDASTTGDIIPFTVTAAGGAKGAGAGGTSAVWLRVSDSPTHIPTLSTAASAFPGSFVPVYITLDLPTVATLEPGSYAGSITFVAQNVANGSVTIFVSLVVSAGGPSMRTTIPASAPIFPTTIIAGPVIDPVITIYGDNFFSTSVVTIQLGVNPSITVPVQLISRKILQATIKKEYFSTPITAGPYPVTWTLAVTNPAPANNPTQAAATTTLDITDPAKPTVTSVVNAASYLTTSTWTGTIGANPVATPHPTSSVSAREIVSIFGQNLGPTGVNTVTPVATLPSTTLVYPNVWTDGVNTIQVGFTYLDATVFPAVTRTTFAPLIMVSNNQINAVVPTEVGTAVTVALPNPTITVQVIYGVALSNPLSGFPLTLVEQDPGAFTFGGLGQGQAAVLNYDSSGAATINSTKNAALRNTSIAIFLTGMGELTDTSILTGQILPAIGGAIPLQLPATCRVDIDGQPAVVTYAGTAPGAVAGLVQVNAIVPQPVRAGQAITITVSIGDQAVSRRTQANVTLSVK